jgi:uncharacterized metal-binding protein
MSLWAIAVLAAFAVIGVLLRLRFGNLYRRSVEAFEARSVLDSKTALMLIGGATVAVWLIIAFTADEASRGGLEQLIEWFRMPGNEPETAD